MTPRKGDRVRVTYEAVYVEQIPSFGSTRHILRVDASDRRPEYSAPPDATLEVIEDLRENDVVLDADGDWLIRGASRWRSFDRWDVPDSEVQRPFKLHVRDGQVIQP